MKTKEKKSNYLRRSEVLPNLTKFDAKVKLKKRKTEEFVVLPDGYFLWREDSEKDVTR